MKPEIKERVEEIRKGEVPEGFKTSLIKECCEILDNQRVPIKDSERILHDFRINQFSHHPKCHNLYIKYTHIPY